MGKEVDFYPNSYFENEVVYALLIRTRFLSVCWKGAGTDSSHKPSRAFDPSSQTRRTLRCRGGHPHQVTDKTPKSLPPPVLKHRNDTPESGRLTTVRLADQVRRGALLQADERGAILVRRWTHAVGV